MKTRLIALLTAVLMTLALAACHKTETVEVSTVAPVTETVTVEESTTEKTEKDAAEKTVSTTVIKNDVNLVGTWSDKVSQRATMEVRGGQGEKYSIHVHWGSTAFESEDWTMTGTFNDTTGELTYKDCTRKTVTFSQDGGEEKYETHYTNGTGKFLYKNGELSWQAANDSDVNECVFQR